VEWHTGQTHAESYAESVAPPDYWELVDVIAVISSEHKTVSSREGHQTAATSDLQNARVAGASARLQMVKRALLERDFTTFASVVEHDSNLMHAVMMTSKPPLFYWLPGSLTVMAKVRQWRADGLRVCYTLDAGPNVHCICIRDDAEAVRQGLLSLPEVRELRTAGAAGPTVLIPTI
jgi:diphosphomevalonate decarboxylase